MFYSNTFSKNFFLIDRRLTPEQKALILSYAELDKDVDGTVNGLTQTKTGKKKFGLMWKIFLLIVGSRVINEDDYPLLKSIRNALSNLPLGSKKLADTIDEQEIDTKRNSTAKQQKSTNK
jgi:hypothetical protein